MDQQLGTPFSSPTPHHQRLRTPRLSPESLTGGEGKAGQMALSGFNQYMVTASATQGPMNTELPPLQEPSVTTLVLAQEASKGKEEQKTSMDSQFSAKSCSLEHLQSSAGPVCTLCWQSPGNEDHRVGEAVQAPEGRMHTEQHGRPITPLPEEPKQTVWDSGQRATPTLSNL